MPPENGDGMKVTVRGRGTFDGVPNEIEVSERTISEALADPVSEVVEAVRIALEAMPPELRMYQSLCLGRSLFEHAAGMRIQRPEETRLVHPRNVARRPEHGWQRSRWGDQGIESRKAFGGQW